MLLISAICYWYRCRHSMFARL